MLFSSEQHRITDHIGRLEGVADVEMSRDNTAHDGDRGQEHGGMSMNTMISNMRKRFLVAILFAIPVTLYSELGREVFNFTAAPPFGLRNDAVLLKRPHLPSAHRPSR